MLYLAMEDYRVDVIVGKGPVRLRFRWTSLASRSLAQPPAPVCSQDHCDRFGFTAHMEFYDDGTLRLIVTSLR